MRILEISFENEKLIFSFNAEKTKDSEALHFVLCEINPGDSYTVTFKDMCCALCASNLGDYEINLIN